jgi:hypothetical protein
MCCLLLLADGHKGLLTHSGRLNFINRVSFMPPKHWCRAAMSAMAAVSKVPDHWRMFAALHQKPLMFSICQSRAVSVFEFSFQPSSSALFCLSSFGQKAGWSPSWLFRSSRKVKAWQLHDREAVVLQYEALHFCVKE